jgi:HK97 family phage prohead protease
MSINEHGDIRLRLELADSSMKENTLAGNPAVMGNLDAYNDVIFPGAFTSVLSDFLKNGVILADHTGGVEDLVGYPTKVEERGSNLYSEFEFHSTTKAQDVRTITRERLAAGKSMGLSIGFRIDSKGYAEFPTGKALLEYASSKGYDLGLFDVKTIERHNTYCYGIWKASKVWEYSVTAFPANLKAGVKVSKDLGVPHGGTPIEEQFLMTLGLIEELEARVVDIANKRDAKGGKLGRKSIDNTRLLANRLLTLADAYSIPDDEIAQRLLNLRLEDLKRNHE